MLYNNENMLFNTSKVYKIQQTDQVLSIYIKSHGSFFALTSLPGVNYTLYVYSSVYVIGSNGDIVGKASLSLSLSLSAREVLCRTEACGPAEEARFSYLCHLGSSLSVHVCHPRGVLPVYWACRVFSGFRD